VKDDVFRRLVGFVLEDMPLGSSLVIYDAYQLQTITQLEVPKMQAFRSGKTRANQFKEPINKLKNFLATDHQRPEAPAKLDFTQAVRFPQFMDFVGENAGARATMMRPCRSSCSAARCTSTTRSRASP
jgi:hypothetical protein